MQTACARLLRTLFQRDTSDNVPLAPHAVASSQVFKIIVKDENLI